MMKQKFAFLGLAFAILGVAACSDKVTIPENPPPPLEITVTPQTVNLEVGQNAQIVAAVTGGEATTDKSVTWTSSNTAVATISANGNVVTVNGVAAGVATISATATADANVKAAAVVNVTAAGGSVPPSITIKSITTGATNVPVNINNVVGQIEITLNLDVPSGTSVSALKILANGTEIYSQNLSSPELGANDEAQSASEIVASWNTADFDRTLPATVGTRQGKFKNGSTDITAQVIGPQGTITAATSQTIILNNLNFVFVKRSSPSGSGCVLSTATSVGFPAAVTGTQWCTGDVTFDAVGVSFTGNANDDLASLSLTGTGNIARTVTAATAPFQLTLQKASTPTASSIATMEWAGVVFNTTGITAGGQPLTGCVVNDASPAPLNLNCAVLGGLVLQANPLNVDNVAPAVTLFDLTPATLACAPATACYINGAFSFAIRTGFFAAVDQGVGSVTATFQAGPAGTLAPVTTGNDLDETVVPSDIVSATVVDLLANSRTVFAGPVAATPLTSATGAQLIGVDKTAPTSSVSTNIPDASTNFAATSPAWTISFSDGGVGPSGFSANPVRVQVKKTTPAGDTCYVPDSPFTLTVVTGTGISTNGCTVTASGAAAYQIDDGIIDIDYVNVPGTSEGYWQIDGFVMDQATNASTPNFGRITLLDVTPPVVGGIAGPSSLPGGQSATFSAGLADNVDLLNIAPSLDYGATTFQFPTVALGAYGVADGLLSSATGSFTVSAFTRAIEATLGTGRASGAVTEATTVRFDVNDMEPTNTTTATLGINPAVQFAAGGPVPSLNTVSATIFAPANVAHGNFLNLAPNPVQVCQGTATACGTTPPASTVLSATMSGPNATFANPFVRVEFYYQDPVNARWYLIGTGTPSASDNTVTSTRTWTYSVTWTVTGLKDSSGAALVNAAVNLVAVGVHSSGSALISTGTPQTIDITAT
jgi:Bacterial Ig-like domain (group 2)